MIRPTFPSASLTEVLVDNIAALAVIPADLERAALHLLDWTGVSVAALEQPIALGMARLLEASKAQGEITLISGGQTTLEQAILFNGALGNTLEMDDVHREAVLHAGDVVIPAALGVAESLNASGEALLVAILEGYQLALNLAIATGAGHYKNFYPTATTGIFGATLAISGLMGLDRDAKVNALGHAGMMASGLWQCRLEACEAKQTIAAHAAASALRAAQMAQAGLRAPKAILEGPLGFFAGLAPAADLSQLQAPQKAWRLHEVSFKPWPACRHVHPAIGAAIEQYKAGVLLDDILSVEVETYATAVTFADEPKPDTAHKARFSLQHGVAVGLLKGDFGLEDSAEAALQNPVVAALRAKVRVSEDPLLSANYPMRYSARLRLIMARQSPKEILIASAKGDPENPMSPAEVKAKARKWLSLIGKSEAAEALISAAIQLPEGQTRDFTAALSALSLSR